MWKEGTRLPFWRRTFRKNFRISWDALTSSNLFAAKLKWAAVGKARLPAALMISLNKGVAAEKSVKVSRTVGDQTTDSETHKVDFCKGRVAVEVEWNNKDPFFSRDLNAFRLLHELDVVSVCVLITRMDELQKIFDSLGRDIGKKYGASTTHWSKLMPRVEAGGAGACPLLLIGITANATWMTAQCPTTRCKPHKADAFSRTNLVHRPIASIHAFCFY